MKEGQQRKHLGDVLEVQNGYAFDSGRFNPTKGMPLIRIRSLKPGTETETRFDGDYDKKYVVKAGDLLIGMDGEFGCYEWKGESALLNQRVCRLQGFSGELVPRFLFYGVNDYLKAIEDVTGYATVKHLSSKQILAIEFPIPPLAEQQRIVGLLDEAFAGIATAKANTEKNLQNARALFESHLQSVFTQRGKGWVEKNLGDLCEVFADGDWVESKDQSQGGIRLIQTGNVGEGLFKDRAEKARYISEATFKRLRCTEIFEGDCLISRLPDPVGRSCILPNTGERMITAVDCTIVRFDQKQLLPTLFNHYTQSDAYLKTVAKECTGTTRNRISRSNLALTPIPVPPLPEQELLAAEFDALREDTQRLTHVYERKLAVLEALKKSLLHEAFSGQL